MLHARWHGWTPTDLVFPFFLFIVGVAITLSATSTGRLGGGVAAIVLAVCSAWSDGIRDFHRATPTTRSWVPGWRLRTSEPFVALGRNAILLFVLSGLIARVMGLAMVDPAAGISLKGWIYATLFAPFASARNASLLFALTNLLLLYALLAWLHRRRLYWKV